MSYSLNERIGIAEAVVNDLDENQDFLVDAYVDDIENNNLSAERRVALQRKDSAEKKNNNSKDAAFYRKLYAKIKKRQKEVDKLAPPSPSPPPIRRGTRPATRRAPSRSRSPVRRRSSSRSGSPVRRRSGSPAGTRPNNRGGGKKTRKRSK